MNLTKIRFPRQLEADGTAETIRGALALRTVKLWPGGEVDVAAIVIDEPLRAALRLARLQGRIQIGFETVSDRLAAEGRGIANVRRRGGVPYGDRLSRVLLFSNDGAERFYRHVESLLQAHAPRILGLLLDVDGFVLGRALTGQETRIKLLMVEHKDAVADILRTLIAERKGERPGGDAPRAIKPPRPTD